MARQQQLRLQERREEPITTDSISFFKKGTSFSVWVNFQKMEAYFGSHLQAMLESRVSEEELVASEILDLYTQYGLPVPDSRAAPAETYRSAFADTYLLLTDPSLLSDTRRLQNTLYLLCRLQDMPRMQQLLRSWVVPDTVMAELYLDFLRQKLNRDPRASACIAFMEDITTPWSFSDRYNRPLLRAMGEFAQSRQQALYLLLLGRLKLSLNLELTGELCLEAGLAGPNYLEPLLVSLSHQYQAVAENRLQPMVVAVLRATRDELPQTVYAGIYRSLLVYFVQGKLTFWTYLPLCLPCLIEELLQALIAREGLQEAARQVEQQVLRNLSPLFEAGLLPALLELLDIQGQFHPRWWLRSASPSAVKFVLSRYSQLVFGGDDFSDPLTARLCIDHNRQLYLQHRPLMRRLCLEFNQYGHSTMTTQLELETLGPQARYSLLWWLQEAQTELPRWQEVSAALITSTLQSLFQAGQGEWLLLQLGFADPVPPEALQGLSARLEKCIRYVTAYEEVEVIVHLLGQLADFNLRRSYLKTVAATAVIYDRQPVLAWLREASFRCGDGFQMWLSELAASYGRPPPVWR